MFAKHSFSSHFAMITAQIVVSNSYPWYVLHQKFQGDPGNSEYYQQLNCQVRF